MKILYIHQYFNTPKMPGSTRSYEFARRLVDRGDNVYMVTSNWQGKVNKSFSNIEGINVYWAPIKYNNKMNYFKRLNVYFRFIWYVFSLGRKLNYDLIIASSTPLTIAIPAILLKRLKGVKMIFEVRDLWPQLPIAIGAIKSSIIISFLNWFEKTTYENSNHIICLSSGMKDELSSRTPINKISVVTNLSDHIRFQKNIDQKKLKEIIPFDSKKQFILYAGAFGRINDVLYLVEIAKIMKNINPDIIFLLIGNGYHKNKIIFNAKKYGIYNKSLFCKDYISKELMPSLLSKSTLVTSLFIDLKEMENNSANKFFDGLAAGKPIIINYGGWQQELIENNKCGFTIPKNNVEDAAKTINSVMCDEQKLIKMSEASRKLAYKFDIETNYEKFEKIIDSVIKQ